MAFERQSQKAKREQLTPAPTVRDLLQVAEEWARMEKSHEIKKEILSDAGSIAFFSSAIRLKIYIHKLMTYKATLDSTDTAQLKAIDNLITQLNKQEKIKLQEIIEPFPGIALIILNAKLENNPNLLKARFSRASIYQRQGKYKKAFNDYKYVLEKIPDNQDALKGLKECKLSLEASVSSIKKQTS